jgi:hypothetical protein
MELNYWLIALMVGESMVKYTQKSNYLQNNFKIIQFLTQVEESRLKIILNNIIISWCSSLSL